MALTKIVKGMLASESVTPDNLVNTGTYTVGGLTSNGNISATGNASVGGSLSIASTLTTTAGIGLHVDGVFLGTATNLLYYNPTTKEVSYAGPGASSNPFNQTLNTNSNVTFASVTAGTITIGGQTLGGTGTVLTLAGLTATNITVLRTISATTGTFSSMGANNTQVAYTSTWISSYSGNPIGLKIQMVETFNKGIEFTRSGSIYGDVAGITNTYGNSLSVGASGGQLSLSGTGSSYGISLTAGDGSTGLGIIQVSASKILPYYSGSFPNPTVDQIDIGAPQLRFNVVYAKSINVLNNTIYFENTAGTTTSTLSLTSGVVTVNGTDYVDQPVTSTSTPTFAGLNVGSIDLDSITAATATFTNLTVIGTMTTLNVTTENVTQENVVTQHFADGTNQTTAWTGTVANSQITSVSTSKVNGLSVVGWTNNYNDLINKPSFSGSGDRITSGTYSVIINSSGTLVLPSAGFQIGGINANGGVITEVDAIVGTTAPTPLGISNGGYTWSFESTGTFQFPDGTQQITAGDAPGQTKVYARSALPSGTTGRIITISDSGSDLNAPAGNFAPAYWDPDASVWTYIGNSNSVTPI